MNRLGGRHARERIVAYVESYDDVFFWSNLLRPLETDKYYFEVMLPSRTSLCKGKKIALANELGPRLGKCMIACVDADYDYLMQGATLASAEVCNNPYVFHTYVYAIENYQCYAPAMQQVCVMATLNDHHLFDFESFMRQYSQTIWPLFVWNVWCYRYGTYKQFSMLDFYHIVQLGKLNFYHPEQTLEKLRHLVNAKIARLQRQFPQGRSTYKPLRNELLRLGLTPETTYLYMRGQTCATGWPCHCLTWCANSCDASVSAKYAVWPSTMCKCKMSCRPTKMPQRPLRRCCASTPPTPNARNTNGCKPTLKTLLTLSTPKPILQHNLHPQPHDTAH